MFGSYSKRNETAYKEKKSRTNSSYISHNDRNRRLIPYATYYVSGSKDHNNHIQKNPTIEDEISGEENDKFTTSRIQQPVKYVLKANNIYNNDYRQDLITGYSYIPIAYITGIRDINHNPDFHYYPNTHYHNHNLPTFLNIPTTAKPKYTTNTPANSDKKVTFSYFNHFIPQQNEGPSNDYLRHLNTPITNTKYISQYTEIKKPTFSAVQSHPVLFTTPQTDYLNFRYSDLYKTQHSKYDFSTTPATIEITSPKHYTVSNEGITSTAINHLQQVTTLSYPLIYEYPDSTQFSHLPSLRHSKLVTKPVQSLVVEQSTQSSKTLMTIMKNHEVQYQPKNMNYATQYSQKLNHNDFSVDDIFKNYNINKQLPEKITSENIKESIKTLSFILQILQKADSITQFQKEPIIYSKDVFQDVKEPSLLLPTKEHKSVNYLQNVDVPYDINHVKNSINSQLIQDKPTKDDQNTPGRAGIDYPIYSIIPETSFTCKSQRYKGFFADPDTKCQVKYLIFYYNKKHCERKKNTKFKCKK